MHHFGDASQSAYGACSYLRQITDTGIECSLVLAKSRVAPLKKITVPRLELQGALTAIRLAKILRKELKMEITQEYFWTDSQIVLGYINNDTRHFHTYVANRVAEIREASEPSQWRHVLSQDNPADLASRGATPQELQRNRMWLNGPRFLEETDIESYINRHTIDASIPQGDPEVRKTTLATAMITTPSMAKRFSKYSTLETLIRSIAILQLCAKQRAWKRPTLTPKDLEAARTFIIRTTQQDSYPSMAKESCLSKLNPTQDTNGVLRLNGRVDKATHLSDQECRPVIIPKNSHLAQMIVRHYHNLTYHLGRRSTLAAIREAGYWLVNGMSTVKTIIRECVSCRRLRGATETQLMGQLPKERLEPTPPFTNIGVDAFGPFHVKDRRTELKRWGLIITCLYSRAIHIEMLDDMTTDQFIQALRRFTALRGPITSVTCDNGSNFVGMKNLMDKQIDAADAKLKEYLLQNRVEFKFNSPSASHQAGATERLIRSVRAVLNSMALRFKGRLDTTTLRTTFCEAANIVNSRPLTATPLDEWEERVITPNRLLTMKQLPLETPPPGEFPPENLYSKQRWKAAEHLAEEFWKAWKTDYLGSIMTRQKWKDTRGNIKVGDLVMVKDETAPRGDWKMGQVTETIPGEDGLVRNTKVEMANRRLDRHGRRLSEPTVLTRPIQKLVLLVRA